jgi:hypothetical protein
MKILFLSAPVGNRTADTLLKGNLPIYTHDGTSVKLIDLRQQWIIMWGVTDSTLYTG